MQKRDRNPAPLPDFAPVPRKQRHDGWTPTRQRAFIEALADTGSVKHAARSVGMSSEGAYYLRRQAGAAEFAAAWTLALDHGIRHLEDVAMERAIHGVEQPIYCYGKIVGTRMVHNDRLIMFMLRNRAADRFSAGASGKRLNREDTEWIAQIKAQAITEHDHAQEDKYVDAIKRVRAHMAIVRERLMATDMDEEEISDAEGAEGVRWLEEWKAREGEGGDGRSWPIAEEQP